MAAVVWPLRWHPDAFVTEGRLGGKRARGVGLRRSYSARLGASAQIKSARPRAAAGSVPISLRVGQRSHFSVLISIAGKAKRISQQDLCRGRSALPDQNKLRLIFKNTRKVPTETRLGDTGVKPDLRRSRQVRGLLCGLYAGVDTKGRPEITGYEQEIRRRHKSLRRKLNHWVWTPKVPEWI